MKRSPLKRRSKPMKRTPMKRERSRVLPTGTEASNSTYWKVQADKLWASLIRQWNHHTCAMCNAAEPYYHLEAHHLVNRTVGITRHNLDNGICLCKTHHALAHLDHAAEFHEWLKEHRHFQWTIWNGRKGLPAKLPVTTWKENYEALLALSKGNEPCR